MKIPLTIAVLSAPRPDLYSCKEDFVRVLDRPRRLVNEAVLWIYHYAAPLG